MNLNIYIWRIKLRSILLYLILFIASVLFSLFVAEICIRIYIPQPIFLKIASPIFDKNTGAAKETQIQVKGLQSEEYNVDQQANTLEFHDVEHEIGPFPSVYRIVILGDSFAKARQVPLKDTWYKQLETILQKRTNKKVEIINLGIDGAGTGWELLILKKLGLKYRPNMVLLGFHLGSDFFNNHPQMEDKYYKPFFKIRDGKVFLIDHLELEIYVRRVWMPLWKISHLYRYLHRSLYKIRKGANSIRNGMPVFFGQYLVNPPTLWDEAENYTQFFFKEIQALTVENGCSLVTVSFPDKYQIYDDLWIELKNQWPVMWNMKWDVDAPMKRLHRVLNRLDIPCIDLVPILRKKALSMDRLYFQKDIHWNFLGNRVVAEVIAENIIEYILKGEGGE